jgi:hypothetical protein
MDFSRLGSRVFWVSGLLASIPAILLFSVWNRIFAGQPGAAVLSTFLGGLLFALIFISAALLWQGKESRIFGPTSYILCLATALSGFWLLVFYPAVMSSDAVSHWKSALANRYSTWHSPLLPMLMHGTQFFVKSPALLSFIQGTLFWAALFFLIRQVAKSNRAFLGHSILVALLPPLWLYSNATISNTWGAIFLMLTMGILIKSVKTRKESTFFLSLLALSIAAMFRREAVLCAVVPIVIYLFYFPKKTAFAKKAAVTVIVVVVSVAPARLIELSPNVVRIARSQIHGVFNQYVGTIVHSMKRMDPSEIERERRSIDGQFGKGVFRKLIQGYVCSTGDYIIFSRGSPSVLKRIPVKRNPFILKKVVQTAIRHPGGYLRHQLCFLGHLSQFSEIAYQSWGVLKKSPRLEANRVRLRIAFKSQLPSIKAGYVKLMDFLLRHPVFSLVFRHYIFLSLSAIFLGLGFIKRKIEWIIPSLVGLICLGAYLLAGTAGLWRYLLPSYLGAWVCWPDIVSSVFPLNRKTNQRPVSS